MADRIHRWVIKPNGTEGYRTAEVTLGGVDCDYVSSKTMETNAHKGLYFVGEVLDVTGWLVVTISSGRGHQVLWRGSMLESSHNISLEICGSFLFWN